MDLATLAAILGHASLRMVLKYVHIRQDHMDAEMDRLALAQSAQAPPRPQPIRNQAHSAGFGVNASELPN
jgi:hypothetical protein